MKGRTGKPSRQPERTISKSVLKAARVRTHGGHFGGEPPMKRPDRRARGGGIHIKASHKGLLHKDTGTAKGKKIPESKIKEAEHSKNPAVRKRAVFAENAKKWNHG
jgi:hypothetical protein